MTYAMRIGAILIAAAVTTSAAASDFRQFRNWYATCDNLRNCSAYGFDADGGVSTYIRIDRGGAPNAPIRVSVTADVPAKAKFTLRFDDPALPGLPTEALTGEEADGSDSARRVRIAAADALIASLRKAQTIVVTRDNPPDHTLKDDEKTSAISLSGASAALLWIDEQQKRLDTDTALIRRGPKPASAIPAQPKPPVIVAARPFAGAAPPKPAAALLAQARKTCGDDDDEDDQAKFDEASTLANGLFLYSYSCPGSSGAYNAHAIYLMVSAAQPQNGRAVTFDWPVKVGDTVHDGPRKTATNSFFDAKSMALKTFSKGRGIGDCGSEETWVFDGKTFRLAELKLMVDCKGVISDDWPVVYRAAVKR